MPYGARTYEQYIKEYRKRKGTMKREAPMTRQAWETYQQMQKQGLGQPIKSDIDAAMGRIGLTPGPLTQRIRKHQAPQRELIDILNRLRGAGR